MLDDVDGPRFVQKALHNLWVLGELFMQDFDRRSSLNVLVDRLIDPSHAAFAKLADDAIRANAFKFAHEGLGYR